MKEIGAMRKKKGKWLKKKKEGKMAEKEKRREEKDFFLRLFLICPSFVLNLSFVCS
ncbi:hypothetical protein [Methanosarcina sp. 2.H.A.1B.4]|uniref:hypothetical protein n=1 Tax=Methanosarcina sp. 2.H.A.1B.4 TaxID=1483600 RepID=UPI000A60FE3A|nr:hypothetical protein [Methanosarcina sp. 2.H.A.1B.4]